VTVAGEFPLYLRGDPLMERRTFLAIAGAAVILLSFGSWAQGQARTRCIGFLSAFPRADVEAFLGELRPELERLGWVEGRTIEFLALRTTEGSNERLPSMAQELVAQSPDLVLVQSVPATRALMQATKSIPVVMIGVGNPLEVGIVADLAKPAGNVTGSSYLADESIRKMLQILKEAAPRLRSVALFVNPSNQAAAAYVRQMRADTAASGLRAQFVEVSGPADFEAAFAAIRREKSESILIPPEPLIRAHREAIASFAQTHGLPLAVVGSRRYLPASGLISYGPTTTQYAQITARYVDRILKGANPGDLSIEQPARFEPAINLETAKALGLEIPEAVLQRADNVIR
jgi:putative ABC transport system substrate-binding protein